MDYYKKHPPDSPLTLPEKDWLLRDWRRFLKHTYYLNNVCNAIDAHKPAASLTLCSEAMLAFKSIYYEQFSAEFCARTIQEHLRLRGGSEDNFETLEALTQVLRAMSLVCHANIRKAKGPDEYVVETDQADFARQFRALFLDEFLEVLQSHYAQKTAHLRADFDHFGFVQQSLELVAREVSLSRSVDLSFRYENLKLVLTQFLRLPEKSVEDLRSQFERVLAQKLGLNAVSERIRALARVLFESEAQPLDYRDRMQFLDYIE